MIEVKVSELAIQAGIKTAYQFQKASGFPPAMAARIFKGKWKRLDLSTLNTICTVLQCEPSQVLKFTPDKERF